MSLKGKYSDFLDLFLKALELVIKIDIPFYYTTHKKYLSTGDLSYIKHDEFITSFVPYFFQNFA